MPKYHIKIFNVQITLEVNIKIETVEDQSLAYLIPEILLEYIHTKIYTY